MQRPPLWSALLVAAVFVAAFLGYTPTQRSSAEVGSVQWVSDVGQGIVAPACAGSTCVSSANSCGMTAAGTEGPDGQCYTSCSYVTDIYTGQQQWNCGSVLSPPSESLCSSAPHGYHDGVDNNACTTWGWAYDPNTPTQALSVHIYRDGPAGFGTGVGAYTANIARPDVASSFPSGVGINHGYSVNLPAYFKDGQPHTLYAYAIDSSGNGNNPLLQLSPRTIQCPAPAAGPASLTVDINGSAGPLTVEPGSTVLINWGGFNVQPGSCKVQNYNYANGITTYPAGNPSAESGSVYMTYGSVSAQRDVKLVCNNLSGQQVESNTVVVNVQSAAPPPGACAATPDGDTVPTSQGTRTVTANNVPATASNVYFPTWSTNGGQNDIQWYPGVKTGTYTWTGTINFGNHSDIGSYATHVWYDIGLPSQTFCDTADFSRGVEAPPPASSWGNHEGVDHDSCTTWGSAQDPLHPQFEGAMELYKDGPRGTGDNIGRYYTNSSHRFNITLPSSFWDDVVHEIWIYSLEYGCGVSCQTLIANSPRAIHCPQAPTPCASAPNACGMTNQGYLQSGGSCSATPPSNALCSSNLSVLSSAGEGRVRAGSFITISWSATNVTAGSCRVTSNTSPINWVGDSGAQQVSITAESTFTLTCTNLSGSTVSTQRVIRVLPNFQEI